MEAKYNPETTDSSLNLPTYADLINHLALGVTIEDGVWKTKYTKRSSDNDNPAVIQTVSLPKLCTIETYDELIKYVEEMYVNGMILGDEFVMKPGEEQRMKILNDYLKISGLIHLMCADAAVKFVNSTHEQILDTPFGVKMIIK